MSRAMTPEDVVKLIPVGRENAVTKAYITAVTGLPERTVRKMIEEADSLPPVINLSDGKGYFRPSKNDAECVKRFYRQERSRANSIIKRTDKIMAYLLSEDLINVEEYKGKVKVHAHYRSLPKRSETDGQLSFI